MFKNYLGTQYLNVDVDIEAGEEASSTDGIIELEQIEYAESETSVHLAEEDFMDVDVTLEDLKQEDRIETIYLFHLIIRSEILFLIILKIDSITLTKFHFNT